MDDLNGLGEKKNALHMKSQLNREFLKEQQVPDHNEGTELRELRTCRRRLLSRRSPVAAIDRLFFGENKKDCHSRV